MKMNGEWKLESVEEDDQRIVWNYVDKMRKPAVLFSLQAANPVLVQEFRS